ncbi:Protein kinase superfamily protein, partial [Prunus dulcis]
LYLNIFPHSESGGKLPMYPLLIEWTECCSPALEASGESSFGLSYHGGKLMTEPVSVNILWFGTGWQESDREAIRMSVTSLTSSQYLVKDSEVPTLGNWWEIIRQYGDSNNVPATDRVDLGAECFYTGPELNMTLDQVVYIGRSVFNKSSIKDSKEQRQLMDMCSGRFQLEVFAGLKVNILWARAPQNAADQCSMLFHGNSYLGPPNGDEKVDSLVGYMLANVAEEVTNQDGSGWISNDGSGMTDTGKNMSFNVVGLNGYRYIMPYVWDQKTRNCALKLSETCETNAMVILREPKGYLRGGIISKSKSAQCSTLKSNNGRYEKNFKLMSSKVYIEFRTGDQVSFESRGWELSYSAGSDLPQLNLSGEVIIAFITQTDQGEGWSANFYIAHPVNHDKVFVVILIVVLALIAASVSLLAVALAVVRKKLERKNAMDSDESLTLMSTDAIRVENRIGEGPSAVVYRAVSTDGGLVAIKSLRVIAAETELQQEIMAKSSSHPNIISFLGHSQDGLGRHYFVFEYMGRGDLSLNLRERGETLDLDKRIAIALQICSAIQMLHMYLKPPVYHGNITSENIFLDEFYNAKLGGFGAAKYCSSSNRANPEQLSEMAEDIWSFGLLLVELLRGEPLVDRETYKNYRRLEEINELLGSQECVDRRLTIPHETCKMGFAKLGEIAKWCIGSSWRVEGVKLLFSTASG